MPAKQEYKRINAGVAISPADWNRQQQQVKRSHTFAEDYDVLLQERLSTSRATASHSRWQIIYLIQGSNIHVAELLVPLVNLSAHSIYKIVEGYDRLRAEALIYKQRG